MADLTIIDDSGPMTATLHIENTVRDYNSWKLAFDKFDRLRVDGGVRHQRVSRRVEDPNAVVIDLDFDTIEEADTFLIRLQKVWTSPQSQAELTHHATADIREVLEQHLTVTV